MLKKEQMLLINSEGLALRTLNSLIYKYPKNKTKKKNDGGKIERGFNDEISRY